MFRRYKSIGSQVGSDLRRDCDLRGDCDMRRDCDLRRDCDFNCHLELDSEPPAERL